MTGVRRGALVRFTRYLDPNGVEHTDTAPHTGTVLDRAADSGVWWVSSLTAAPGRAVAVKARDMESAA